MSNPLIPIVPTKTVHVVSALSEDGGEYRPLAVFATEEDAVQQVKLIGMSAPKQKPRMDAVWMPAKDCGCPTPPRKMADTKKLKNSRERNSKG